MEDKQELTIEKYGFQVKNRYRSRGAVILDTGDGLRLMREYDKIKGHFAFENRIKDHLAERGMTMTDRAVENLDGELVTEWESGEKYVVYQWFSGEECDYRSSRGLLRASENLGRLHRNLRNLSETPIPIAESLQEKYARQNRELKRVYGYMRDKKRKNKFELYALSCFPEFYKKAVRAAEQLEKSVYFQNNGRFTRDVCHGEYNYHNLILTKKGVATTNFERAGYGMQLLDTAYFFRKVMEKNRWDIEKGRVVMDGYRSGLKLSKEAVEFLFIALSYPVKFRKLMNQYINGKKSWIPDKNMEKLIGVREQEKAKENFLREMAGIEKIDWS